MSAGDFSPYQRSVNYYPGVGWPGDWASANIGYCASFLAGVPMSTGIFVGHTNPPDYVPPGGNAAVAQIPAYTPPYIAPGIGIGTQAIGIAIRAGSFGRRDYGQIVVTQVDPGSKVEVLTEGDLQVPIPEAAYDAVQLGWSLYYKTTDAGEPGTAGTIQAAAPGSTITDYLESPWRVFRKFNSNTEMVLASTFRRI